MRIPILSLTLILCAAAAASLAASETVFETDTFRWSVGEDGKNVSLFDKTGGTEYLQTDASELSCAAVKVAGKTYPASSAVLDGDLLRVGFDGTQVSAALKVTAEKGCLLVEVAEIFGDPDELVFVNIPLKLEAKPYEPFAACALALTPFTHVHQLPALHTAYWAGAVSRFGLIGAKAALVGVPQAGILPAIRETMTENAEGIPASDKGGAWALDSEDGYGSYLMNFGSLTDETVDSWIESCRRLGFNQIDNHGGGFFHFGSLDYQLPGGWESFKRIIDKCHAAGIKIILHTYACYIGQTSRYVTPIPSPDLDAWQDWTLAEPISADADEITVNEPIGSSDNSDSIDSSTFGASTWMSASSRTLRIGNEIVQYTETTKEAPWKFLGCTRGFHGTNVSSHEAGETASLLKTFWSGLYVPKPDSPLWYEIAKNHSDVVNQCGFDGIYFDAIEGLQYMWGKENYWYYGGKFVMDVAAGLDHPVGMEFAGMIHNWWHYRSRYQAWDTASRGYKRFVDIHFGSMKAGEEYQHGCWLGHDPEIDKYAGMKEGGLYLPFQLGWWGISTWGHPKAEPIYRDDIDYIGCKLVGNRSGFSFNTPIEPEKIDADPFLADCVELLRDYGDVRDHGNFDESLLARLREPKKEFKLMRDADGTPWFREMFYKKHKVTGLTDGTAEWTVENEFASQPFAMRLVPFYTPAAYDDPEKGLRFNPEEAAGECEGNHGVTGSIEPNAGTVPATGEPAFAFTAANDGSVPADASWIRSASWHAPESLDAGKKQASGLWICGDGQGEVLNVMVGCCSQLVKIDFTGWKYVELLEADSTDVSHYVWPPIGYSVYSHYSTSGDAGECRVWYNNIPAGKTVRCLIGPITALPYSSYELKNPEITVNGQTIKFPVTMTTGAYLELRDGKCELYTKTGVKEADILPENPVPLLQKGENKISVTAESSAATNLRMEMTVIGNGERIN